MTQLPRTYTDFQRYLAAKRTVDDRALNAHVWECFIAALVHRQAELAPAPLRLLEIGAGIGTMIERLLETNRLPHIDYTAIDAAPQNITVAAKRLTEWSQHHQAHLQSTAPKTASLEPAIDLNLHGKFPHTRTSWAIHLRCLDLLTLLDQPPPASQDSTNQQINAYDGLVAHAFLDLVDAESVLAKLTAFLQPGAHLLLTINFDGATIFQPEIDPVYDRLIETLYHATMDNRIINGQPSGDSQTGRYLYHILQHTGYTLLDAGSSDWFVAPFAGIYLAHEAYFLHFIIDTIYGTLANHSQLTDDKFRQWIARRHAQIEQNELVYIAHQIDYLARYEPQ